MSEILSRHREFCIDAATFQGMTPSTIKGLESTMKQFLKFSQLETVEEFTKLAIKDWIRHGKLERQWSPKTIHIHLCYLGLAAAIVHRLNEKPFLLPMANSGRGDLIHASIKD